MNEWMNITFSYLLLNMDTIKWIQGFFFTVCPAAIMKVAKFSLENDRTFIINLSAPFISQFFKEPLMEAFKYVDILIGNEDVSDFHFKIND